MKALTTTAKVYSKAFKEKLSVKVVYQNRAIKDVARDHDLSNAHILSNWVDICKRGLDKGAGLSNKLSSLFSAFDWCGLHKPSFSSNFRSRRRSDGIYSFVVYCFNGIHGLPTVGIATFFSCRKK